MPSSEDPESESTPNGQHPAEQESLDEGGPEEETGTPSEAGAETVECPNCGHEFEGTYCPACGQEADPSVSTTGVVGGFFRELVDVEHGFWPTFVGLTLRPGTVLRQYLRGVRKGLASPGRYLLAVVVIGIGIDQLLLLAGAASSDSGSSPEEEEGAVKALDVAYDRMDFIFEGQAMIIFFLLMIGPLAALLYRLFEERFDQMAEALAVGSFQAAHAILLGNGVYLVLSVFVVLYTGHPVESSDIAGIAGLMVYLGYIGFASYRCFGPGWWAALKGLSLL